MYNWDYEQFKFFILNANKNLGLPGIFRHQNQTSVMYKMLPGGNGKRFSEYGSVVENLTEAVAFAANTDSEQAAIDIIKAHLAMFPHFRRWDVVEVCLHAVVQPERFKVPTHGFQAPQSKKTQASIARLKSKFSANEFRASAAKRVYDLDVQQKNALKLFMDIFEAPEKVDDSLQTLLSQFQEKLNAGNVSPVELAAFIHQGIINIHPFEDGNGRVARLVMNEVLALYDLPKVNPKRDVVTERAYDAAAATNDKVCFMHFLTEHFNLPADVFNQSVAPAIDTYPVFVFHLSDSKKQSEAAKQYFEDRDKTQAVTGNKSVLLLPDLSFSPTFFSGKLDDNEAMQFKPTELPSVTHG